MYAPSPTRFLNQDEPGGIDDVAPWLALTVAMIPVGAIVGIIAHDVLAREQDGALWCLLTGVGVAAQRRHRELRDAVGTQPARLPRKRQPSE